MLNQTPLNQDALQAGIAAYRRAYYRAGDSLSRCFEKGVSAYVAVAQPEVLETSNPAQNLGVVNSVEDLVTTRTGLALANTAFNEGMSAGIRACYESASGKPFIKPVSPYSAPLLAMIKADRPEVEGNMPIPERVRLGALDPANHDYAWSINEPVLRLCVLCRRPEEDHREES